jgi:hypothetical protein
MLSPMAKPKAKPRATTSLTQRLLKAGSSAPRGKSGKSAKTVHGVAPLPRVLKKGPPNGG